MKAHHLFSLFILVSSFLASCGGDTPASTVNGTATAIAGRAGGSAPTITLNPTTGGANTRVAVRGAGFPAGSRVSLRLGAAQLYAVAVADPDGKVALAFTVPDELPDGASTADQELMVVLASDDTSLQATASFRVQRPTPTQPPTSRPPAAPTVTKPSSEPTGYVNFDFLNVRTGPGTKYDLIAKLNRSQSLSLVGRNSDGTWALVRLPGGQEGWVFTQYLTATVPITSLPVIGDTLPTPTPGRSATTPTPGQPATPGAPVAAYEQDKAAAAAIGFYTQWASGAGPHGNLEKALQYVSTPLADQIRADNSVLFSMLDVPARPQYTQVQITKIDATTAVARATLKIGESERAVDTMLAKEGEAWVILQFQPVK